MARAFVIASGNNRNWRIDQVPSCEWIIVKFDDDGLELLARTVVGEIALIGSGQWMNTDPSLTARKWRWRHIEPNERFSIEVEGDD